MRLASLVLGARDTLVKKNQMIGSLPLRTFISCVLLQKHGLS